MGYSAPSPFAILDAIGPCWQYLRPARRPNFGCLGGPLAPGARITGIVDAAAAALACGGAALAAAPPAMRLLLISSLFSPVEYGPASLFFDADACSRRCCAPRRTGMSP